jgi:DNA-binding LacI/PurR family transcriptional regulator
MYYSDLMAFGGLDYLNENQLEKKISVIGFDGFEMTFHAQLTSVVQPMEEMGARAAQMLIARIQGGSVERKHVVLKPWLFEGQSCARKAPSE